LPKSPDDGWPMTPVLVQEVTSDTTAASPASIETVRWLISRPARGRISMASPPPPFNAEDPTNGSLKEA
jgi:hypothetical protein